MNNSEIAEELLHRADKLNIRNKVLDRAKELAEINPRMEQLDRYTKAFEEILKENRNT